MFDGPELEIKIKSHGNSEQDRSFFQTSATTKECLKKVTSENPPKQAIDVLTKEQGGELEAHEAPSLPCDWRQVKYARQHQQVKDTNLLYTIMLECKLAQGTSQIFVQDVKAAPQPVCILSSEWQLDDMVRFLTNNHRFGILTADTTYKATTLETFMSPR